MILFTLFRFLLLASVVYGQTLNVESSQDNAEYIAKTKRDIEKRLRLDPNRQPFYDSDHSSGHPCWWPFNVNCGTVYYHVHNELFKYSSATAWPKLDVIKSSRFETASKAGSLTLSKSQSVSTTLTEGWSIGVNLGLNQFTGFGGSISYERSKSLSNSNTVTVDVTVGSTCPPYHECHLQIWTWHVTFDGQCANFPKINCGGNVVNVCESTCYDENFKIRWCGTLVANSWGPSSLREVQDSPCQVTSPVFENGEIMTKTKFIEKPRRPTVILWESHDIAVLDIEQKWSESTRLFFTKEQGWMARPDVPEPLIPKEMLALRPHAPEDKTAESGDSDETW